VNWERVDGELPDQARVRGTELIIPSITAADEGTYRCTVRHDAGEVSRQVTVIVQGQAHLIRYIRRYFMVVLYLMISIILSLFQLLRSTNCHVSFFLTSF